MTTGKSPALHERDNPAWVPAGLVPRLKRILFWLQEATTSECRTRSETRPDDRERQRQLRAASSSRGFACP